MDLNRTTIKVSVGRILSEDLQENIFPCLFQFLEVNSISHLMAALSIFKANKVALLSDTLP
jgi:hypothetical protein